MTDDGIWAGNIGSLYLSNLKIRGFMVNGVEIKNTGLASLSKVDFENNGDAAGDGMSLVAWQDINSLNISEARFLNNYQGPRTGGSSVSVVDCLFKNNPYRAMNFSGSLLNLTNSIFINNNDALQMTGGTSNITNCTIYGGNNALSTPTDASLSINLKNSIISGVMNTIDLSIADAEVYSEYSEYYRSIDLY